MKMYHPEIDAIAEVVNIEGYNAVWAPRGWILLPPAEAFASAALGQPVKKLEDLKVDELRGLHSSAGQEYPGASVKKADLIEKMRELYPTVVLDGADEPVEVADPATPDEAAALAAAEAAASGAAAPGSQPTSATPAVTPTRTNQN